VPPGTAPEIAAAIDDLGVGALTGVAERYQDATVTVLPSVDEAFGLVLVESLACGTPVVASDSGGMPEIVTSEVGRLVAPEDIDALAVAVLEAIAMARDPQMPKRCADHAQQWSWDTVGPHHLDAYQAALR
jgi:glycosyltransferase involved in cell wall biosynthesis